jgi:nucleoid DNA-binding protein
MGAGANLFATATEHFEAAVKSGDVVQMQGSGVFSALDGAQRVLRTQDSTVLA